MSKTENFESHLVGPATKAITGSKQTQCNFNTLMLKERLAVIVSCECTQDKTASETAL